MSMLEQSLSFCFIAVRSFLARSLLVFLMLVAALNCHPAYADADNYELKAASLGNFPEFTEWPADTFTNASDPLVIGVLGKDPFGNGLEDAVRGKQAHNRPLVVRHFRKVDEVKSCQVLFVSDSETKRLPRILTGLKGRSILTVSDMPDFTSRGGMVSLLAATNQIQLQVNLDILNAAGLTMSSKLLRTADIVSSAKK
jgi:hypothetical protein